MKSVKLLIITLFAPLWAGAQTLSVDDCVDIALQHNNQITAAQSQVSASRYDVRNARSYFLPQVSLYGSLLYSAAEGGYSSGSGLLPVVDAQGNPTGQYAGFPGIDLHYDLGLVYGGGIPAEVRQVGGNAVITSSTTDSSESSLESISSAPSAFRNGAYLREESTSSRASSDFLTSSAVWLAIPFSISSRWRRRARASGEAVR